MSYDEDTITCYPCPCGKGQYEHRFATNDWGQVRETYVMLCPECRERYIYDYTIVGGHQFNERKRGWVLEETRAREAADERGMRNKVNSAVSASGVEEPHVSSTAFPTRSVSASFVVRGPRGGKYRGNVELAAEQVDTLTEMELAHLIVEQGEAQRRAAADKRTQKAHIAARGKSSTVYEGNEKLEQRNTTKALGKTLAGKPVTSLNELAPGGDWNKYQAQQQAEWNRWYQEEYLTSDHWYAVRGMVLDRAQGNCEWCGAARPLVVHHQRYDRLYRENPATDLEAVCRQCHKDDHDRDVKDRHPANYTAQYTTPRGWYTEPGLEYDAKYGGLHGQGEYWYGVDVQREGRGVRSWHVRRWKLTVDSQKTNVEDIGEPYPLEYEAHAAARRLAIR